MVSAYRGAASFRGDSAVTTWLHRVVVNACLDRMRREKVRPTVPLPEHHDPASPRDEHAGTDARLDVMAALAPPPGGPPDGDRARRPAGAVGGRGRRGARGRGGDGEVPLLARPGDAGRAAAARAPGDAGRRPRGVEGNRVEPDLARGEPRPGLARRTWRPTRPRDAGRPGRPLPDSTRDHPGDDPVTSTAPGAHPPPEEVDALLDLSGGDARVSAHVEACERCSQVRDDLREVRALLGAQARTLPPEPPDLGARIAAALAAEPPLRRSDGAAAPVGRPRAVRSCHRLPRVGPVRGRPGARPAPTPSLARVPRGRRQRGGGRSRRHLPGRHPRRWRRLRRRHGGRGLLRRLRSRLRRRRRGAERQRPAGQPAGPGHHRRARTPRGPPAPEYTRVDLVAQASALLLAADNGLGTQETEPGVQEFADRDRADCLAAVGRSGVEPAVDRRRHLRGAAGGGPGAPVGPRLRRPGGARRRAAAATTGCWPARTWSDLRHHRVGPSRRGPARPAGDSAPPRHGEHRTPTIG